MSKIIVSELTITQFRRLLKPIGGGEFDDAQYKVISNQVQRVSLFNSFHKIEDLLKDAFREASTKRNILESVEKFIKFLVVKQLPYVTAEQSKFLSTVRSGYKKSLGRKENKQKQLVKPADGGDISFYFQKKSHYLFEHNVIFRELEFKSSYL